MWAGDPSAGLPRTFNLYDRQIYIPNDNVSLYSLARKWIQNLPEEEIIAPELPSLQLLPVPPADPQLQVAPQPPQYVDNFTNQHYEPEAALCQLKAHWVQVRQHWQGCQKTKAQRQQQRLVPWLQTASSQPTLPLPPH